MTTTTEVAPGTVERRFRAMGCDAHVIVVGADGLGEQPGLDELADHAKRRIERLEARWSRFRETSELSVVNAAGGRPTLVSEDTYRLFEHAVRAWDLTSGRFDPTVLEAMEQLGYDRDFRSLRREGVANDNAARRDDRQDGPGSRRHRPSPGCGAIRLDPYVRSVALAPGVSVDPGGIGKGLAADMVVAELMELGVAGAMVNLGGDLAARGTAPTDAGWVVGVEDPRDRHRVIARVTIHNGGVCTSSRLRRAWCTRDGRTVHHLVDPGSGDCLATDIASITVVAGAAWWAEALSKAVFVEGDQDRDRVHRLLTHAHALVVTSDGECRSYGDRGVFDLA